MNPQNEKDRKAIFSLGFIALTVLMVGFTAAQVISMSRQNSQGPLLTRETLDQITNDSNTRQYLEEYQAAARELTQKNMFVPPPEGPAEPGECTAIFGDEARIGDRWYKAGDRLGDAEVVAVGPVSVTLLWEGRNITRTPMLVAQDTSNRSSGAGSARNQRGQGGRNQRGMGRGGMRGGRGGAPGGDAGERMRTFFQQEGGQMVSDFMNMSNDQRLRAIQDMRQQFQGGTFEIRTSGSGPIREP